MDNISKEPDYKKCAVQIEKVVTLNDLAPPASLAIALAVL